MNNETTSVGQPAQNTLRKIPKVQCGACEKFFAGNSAFEVHFTGSFYKRERRCLTDSEMYERGFGCEQALVREIVDNHRSYIERAVWYLAADRERKTRNLSRLGAF